MMEEIIDETVPIRSPKNERKCQKKRRVVPAEDSVELTYLINFASLYYTQDVIEYESEGYKCDVEMLHQFFKDNQPNTLQSFCLDFHVGSW